MINSNCKLYGKLIEVGRKQVRVTTSCVNCPFKKEPTVKMWRKGIDCAYQKSPKLGVFKFLR